MQELTVSVAEILGRPGAYRDIMFSEVLEGIRTELARLGDGRVEGDLRLESVVEGVLVSGRVTAPASLQCARCLTDFTTPLELDVRELFATADHPLPAEEDAYEITGAEIDLRPMLRDAVTLALPLNPTCRPSCKGLCAHCGRDLNKETCDCRTEDTDPRWAPLAALRERLKS